MENKIQKNIILAPYTFYQIGGPADFFVIAKSIEELVDALSWAKERRVSVVVIGSGSNILVSDKGFRGFVVLNKANNYHFEDRIVIAESGAILSKIARESIDKSLTGLGFAANIPGTVGGAVIGNAGIPEASISDCLEEVKIWDKNKGMVIYRNTDLNYEYRNSILKGDSSKVVLEARFKLKDGNQKEMIEKIEKDLARRRIIYQGLTCGSYFKNPKGISAGELIDKAGLRGYKCGGAKVSESHGNVIVNTGKAKAGDILKLEKIIINKVKEKFNIALEPEVVKIGEF